MIEDTVIWLFILTGSICIKVFDLVIIDPILSLLIAVYILYQVYKYMKIYITFLWRKFLKTLRLMK